MIRSGEVRDRLIEVCGLVGKPEDAPSNYAIIGRYILQPGYSRSGAHGGDSNPARTRDPPKFSAFRPSLKVPFNCAWPVFLSELAYALDRSDMADAVRVLITSIME